MSQANPYEASVHTSLDPTSIRQVPVKVLRLYQRGIALIGDQYWLFLAITFLAMLIGSVVPMGLLLGVMMVGVFSCFLDREQGKRVELSGLFKGFENIGTPIIASLIMTALSTAVLIPFIGIFLVVMLGPIGASLRNGSSPLLSMLLVLVMNAVLFGGIVLVTIPFMFTYQLIADRHLSAMDAIKVSIAGVRKNFWGLLWFFLVNLIVTMVTTLCCFVPSLFFLPLSMASFYILYRDIFPQDAAI